MRAQLLLLALCGAAMMMVAAEEEVQVAPPPPGPSPSSQQQPEDDPFAYPEMIIRAQGKKILLAGSALGPGRRSGRVGAQSSAQRCTRERSRRLEQRAPAGPGIPHTIPTPTTAKKQVSARPA